jgi:hypothetical protein
MMMNISNMNIPQERVATIWSIDHMTNPYYWDKEYHEPQTHNRRGRKKKENNVRYKGRNMSKRT